METEGLTLEADELESFQRVCAANGTTATLEVKKFIARYCSKYGKAVPGVTVDVVVELPTEIARLADRCCLDLNAILSNSLIEELEKKRQGPPPRPEAGPL